MKGWKKALVVLLSAVLCFSLFTGCGSKKNDIELDENGNIKPSGKVSEVEFWGWGDEEELQVFNNLVASFNAEYEGIIKVKYVQKNSQGYQDAVATNLLGSRPADVVYAGDGEYKQLVKDGSLLDLTNFLEESKVLKEEEMWDSAINRYRYDPDTTTDKKPDGSPASVWGIPKDIGPTVLYYNASQFKQADVEIISVPEDELEKYNEKNGTSYKPRGYYVPGHADNDIEAKAVFNNRIAMSWDEVRYLSERIQKKGIADYGYFTEWWFGYGWSVGGDCIEYVPTEDAQYNGGYWDFTLGDETKNYIVKDSYEGEYSVGNNKYKAGEIIAWGDKLVDPAASTKTIRPEILASVASGDLIELPSQREAFTEFVRLSQKKDVVVDEVNGQKLYGYEITPNPTTISTDGKVGYFTSGKMSMLVDGRWSVVNIRSSMAKGVEWDVAPLPIYKKYDANGDCIAHGVASGHSGSTSLAISKKSRVPQAAWKFVEYVSGAAGQGIQAKAGFAIPNQKAVAHTEDFLQSDQMPKNAVVFIEAAEVQTPGDWWYLKDKKWIDDWAGLLNGDVRNGKKSLSEFFASNEFTGTFNKLKDYTKRK